MLLKKSIIAIASNSHDHFLWSLSSVTSLLGTPGNSRPQRARQYATVRHDENHAQRDDERGRVETRSLKWPSTANPTPYEIFNQPKSAPYNKARFYELVKLYHPDRHHQTSHDGVPAATKVDRYRLAVAANNILGDPERKRLYDLNGSGWGGRPGLPNATSRQADRSWRQQPGNASANATWEDWERWHQQREGVKPGQLYASNIGFVMLLTLFVSFAAWAQATRAGTHGIRLVQSVDEKDAAIRRELRRMQQESAMLTPRGRIDEFLRRRDGPLYDAPWDRHDGHKQSPRVLPPKRT